ncbi:putative RecB family exonuclease [Catenulispora sp. MAP5-51]|uniref:RecB family exonuclease n=1 Tax=Catenulispora sp. MAP5-51 TaxID=3156298 RepID=UPI0035114A21
MDAMDAAVTTSPVTVTAAGTTEAAATAATTTATVTLPMALSPSRASDFMTCPLLFRFRVIDKLPERKSAAATRGTLVHAVLEHLFDLPTGQRTPTSASSMLPPEWERMVQADPELKALAEEAGGDEAWLAGAVDLLERYFHLEDPNRLEPAERELFVHTRVADGLLLRGFVDRLDVAPDGALRVVDYKTGRAPGPAFEGKALFQMKFYALVLWKTRGVVPRRLQLMYLGGQSQIVTYDPDESDLRATERKVAALWSAIRAAAERGEWRPNPSRLCDWCDHKALCPEYGGTPPVLPPVQVVEASDAVPGQRGRAATTTSEAGGKEG